jgi:aquaporin Z
MRAIPLNHWPEYLMEAAGLGTFMLSACICTAILWHPGSPVSQVIADALLQRLLMGIAMGLTAIALIYSPWGQRSGAHLNPAVTLTFFRLGKVEPWDALFYMLAQLVGGAAGVTLASGLLGAIIAHPTVNYVATMPGTAGPVVAFVAEGAISFILMSVVLRVSNTPYLARYTGLCAGALVAMYITLEAPLSGMSMNPARTFGSALAAQLWSWMWMYFIAPPLGMLAAAAVYRRQRGWQAVICAKLNHHNKKRCIFRCGYRTKRAESLGEEISHAGS